MVPLLDQLLLLVVVPLLRLLLVVMVVWVLHFLYLLLMMVEKLLPLSVEVQLLQPVEPPRGGGLLRLGVVNCVTFYLLKSELE